MSTHMTVVSCSIWDCCPHFTGKMFIELLGMILGCFAVWGLRLENLEGVGVSMLGRDCRL